MADIMKAASYLIYIIAFEALVLGGVGYAVFFRGASGWWFLLAIIVSGSAYPPERWSALWDEAVAAKYQAAKATHKDEAP